MWDECRPHAMMRLSGVQALKAELEALEARVRGMRVPDEDDTVHLALRQPAPPSVCEWPAVNDMASDGLIAFATPSDLRRSTSLLCSLHA